MVKIRLFGRCALESDATVIQDINCAKARELLGYLACHRERHLSREAVIGALWGDMQEEQGKRALRQTLWQLQTALGPFQITASRPFIEADGEWIRLNPDSGIWLDVARFEELEKMTRRIKGHPYTETQLAHLNEAVSIYRGQLMEDCFKDWCVRQRHEYNKCYLKMLTRLMNSQKESGDYEGAMTTASMVLREEPASESANGTLMLLYHNEGDRTSALRQFEQYKRTVREVFNVPPSKALSDLNKKIREDLGQEIISESDTKDAKISAFEERVIAILESIREEMARNRKDIRHLWESIEKKNPGQVENEIQ
jgi:DNA-binding SARP family transcriptional activator